jgi:hypothetical protein
LYETLLFKDAQAPPDHLLAPLVKGRDLCRCQDSEFRKRLKDFAVIAVHSKRHRHLCQLALDITFT